MTPAPTIDDPAYVKAVSHPLRVRILAILQERAASPNELAGLLGASLGVVSYHVRTLNRLGMLELVRETPRRGAVEHHYRARSRPTVSDEGWGRTPPIAKQAYLSAFLHQVHDYTSLAAAAGGFDRQDAHFTRTALRIDEQGFQELAGLLGRNLDEIEAIEAAAAARLATEPHSEKAIEVGLVMLLFEAVRFSDRPPPTDAGHTAEPAAELA